MKSNPPWLLGLLLVVILSSCVSTPPIEPLSSFEGPPGGWSVVDASPLVDAQVVTTIKKADSQGILRLGSSFLLSFNFNTRLLKEAGFDTWRRSEIPKVQDVLGIRITFDTRVTPQGGPDRQSGLLLLPAPRTGVVQSLTWVIWAKSTELDPTKAPSLLTSGELMLPKLLASLGYGVWVPDYLGFGASGGVQTYCVPESLGLSLGDGLRASRAFLGSYGRAYQESGRLSIIGYSQGGLAAMAGAAYFQAEPQKFPGLTLERVYSMGAPLDLMIGSMDPGIADEVLDRPEYTIYLVLGWARAYPELILPEAILKPSVISDVVPLFSRPMEGDSLHLDLLKAMGKPRGGVTYRDIFLPSYLSSMATDPSSVPYFQAQRRSRLDQWIPGPGTELILAASPSDEVVSPGNSKNSLEWIQSNAPEARVRFYSLQSKFHRQAGGEALLFAIQDFVRSDRGRLP